MSKARAELVDVQPPITEAEWHPRLGPLPTQAVKPEPEEAEGPSDPSLRAFLALEKSLQKRTVGKPRYYNVVSP